MTTPHFSLYGIQCAMMLPEDTPEFGHGEHRSIYMTEPENEDDEYMCVFAFETEEKLVAHNERVLQIKDAAADANQRRTAAGILTPDISFWIPFLVLVRRFKEEWGTNYVPKDIQDATTDVETVHGIALTFPN
jgi:hypothetical protein